MNQSTCNTIGGTYVGGAECTMEMPCPFQNLPVGYEVVTITPPEMNEHFSSRPQLNDCGEIAFYHAPEPGDLLTDDVYWYDNELCGLRIINFRIHGLLSITMV